MGIGDFFLKKIIHDYGSLFEISLRDRRSRVFRILKILNLTDEIKVNKVKSDYFKKTFFAERPDSENLINKKLNQKGLNLMRPWQETLREYINTSYIKYL